MYRKLCIIGSFLVFVNLLSAQPTENTRFSLLTCGPGFEFFECFGHTALRVCDSTQGIDLVFNWGVFNFNTDNFYLKFAQGQLLYMLGISSYSSFIASYAREGRSIFEQHLGLKMEEKQALWTILTENSKPENRHYLYDFFEDNCATRVRDIIQKSLSARAFPEDIPTKANLSYRELFYPYTENYLWWRFGIDIALGMRSDRKVHSYDYMYLPDNLMMQFDTTILVNDVNVLVSSKETILDEMYPHSTPTLFSPDHLFWILFIVLLGISLLEWRLNKYFKAIDMILFTAVSLLSLLVFYLCFISDHSGTKENLNLLWANPLFIYVLFRLQRSQPVILYIIFGFLAILIAGFWLLPQSFNSAFFPIWLMLALRIGLIWLRQKKEGKLETKKPIYRFSTSAQS